MLLTHAVLAAPAMEGGAGTPHGGRLLDHQRALPDAVTGAAMTTASLHASPSTGHVIPLADGGGGGGAGGVDGVRHASRPGRYVAALLALSLVAVCMCMAWQSAHPQATSSSMHHPSLRHIRTARVLSAQPFYVPPGDVVAAAYRGPAHTASWGAAMPAAAAVPGVMHVGDSNAQVLCGLDTASTTPYAFENGAANAIEVVLCASSHDCEKKVSCVPHIPPHSTATLNVPSGYDLMVVLFCDPSGSPCMGEHTWSSTLGPQGWTRPLVLPFMGSPYCNTASGQDFCTATVRWPVGVCVCVWLWRLTCRVFVSLLFAANVHDVRLQPRLLQDVASVCWYVAMLAAQHSTAQRSHRQHMAHATNQSAPATQPRKPSAATAEHVLQPQTVWAALAHATMAGPAPHATSPSCRR